MKPGGDPGGARLGGPLGQALDWGAGSRKRLRKVGWSPTIETGDYADTPNFHPYLLLALGAALVAPLPGCNRDDVTPPIIIQTPEPTRGVIVSASFPNFASDTWFQIPIDIQSYQPGVLDITVDWTSDESWVFVYFGARECTFDELAKGTCPFLIASETKDPKPRVVFTDLLQPSTYYVTLYNVPRVPGTDIGSDFTESVSLQLGLTVFPGQSSGDEPPLRLGRLRRLSRP